MKFLYRNYSPASILNFERKIFENESLKKRGLKSKNKEKSFIF